MKLLSGDSVLVIAGKDKGKKGTVLKVFRQEHRVLIGGVNMLTKYVKRTTQEAGKMIKFEASIPAAKVMLLDPKTGKPTRIGYKVDDKGKKVRVAKVSDTVLGKVKVEQPKVEGREVVRKPDTKGAMSTGTSTKAATGPAKATPTHTRSAGRGS